jgi:hypothetical protein
VRLFASAAIFRLRHESYRLKFTASLLAAVVAVLGCTQTREVMRTSLRDPVKLSEGLRTMHIALLDIATVPKEVPMGASTRLISFPDEVLID